MPNNKKLLIISCTNGMGHIRAAEALRLSCQQQYPSIEVVHFNIADYLNIFTYFYVISGYKILSKYMPSLYRQIYYQTDRTIVQKIFTLMQPLFGLGAKKFFNYVAKEVKPDVIIATHFLPSLLLPKNFPIPMDTIITDYHAHAIWLSPNNRNLFVPTEQIQRDLQKLSISSIVSGIPLNQEFFAEKDVAAIKNRLGLANNWPTILVMPIFASHKRFIQLITNIRAYKKELNLVVVTGKNDSLFKKLEKDFAADQTGLILLKNSNSIDEWMRVADAIVSKAGGLTISEALCLQKPIIVINPIPGQEEYNTIYLEENKYGTEAQSRQDVVKKIDALITGKFVTNKKSYSDPSKIILLQSLN